jgi:hypothetical protein
MPPYFIGLSNCVRYAIGFKFEHHLHLGFGALQFNLYCKGILVSQIEPQGVPMFYGLTVEVCQCSSFIESYGSWTGLDYSLKDLRSNCCFETSYMLSVIC